MSDKSFATAVGFILGTRTDVTGLFCPRCAAAVMNGDRHLPEAKRITYVETVKTAGTHARCAGCGVFPLVLSAEELLTPQHLLNFMGRVFKMAERAALEEGMK